MVLPRVASLLQSGPDALEGGCYKETNYFCIKVVDIDPSVDPHHVSELVLDCPADAGPAELAGLLRAAVEEGRLDTTANRAFRLTSTRPVDGKCKDLLCWSLTQTTAKDQRRLLEVLLGPSLTA